MRTACHLFIIACLTAASSPAQRQGGPVLTVAGLYAIPLGDVATYLSPGWGGVANLAWRRPPRVLDWQAEASYTAFPFSFSDAPYQPPNLSTPLLVQTGGTRLTVAAGPAVTVRRGVVGAGVKAGVGAAYAHTVMATSGLGSDDRYNRRKTYSDLAPFFEAGAGLSLALGGVTLSGAADYGLLGPTSYGIDGAVKVGVISGPYWHPAKAWSRYLRFRLGAVLGGL